MFAGTATAALVQDRLNTVGNVINMQGDAHTTHDDLEWGIEAAQGDNGKVKAQTMSI